MKFTCELLLLIKPWHHSVLGTHKLPSHQKAPALFNKLKFYVGFKLKNHFQECGSLKAWKTADCLDMMLWTPCSYLSRTYACCVLQLNWQKPSLENFWKRRSELAPRDVFAFTQFWTCSATVKKTGSGPLALFKAPAIQVPF